MASQTRHFFDRGLGGWREVAKTFFGVLATHVATLPAGGWREWQPLRGCLPVLATPS